MTEAIAFSLDSRQLASSTNYKTVWIWDIAIGITIQTLQGYSHWIRAIAFSPDSKQPASGSYNGTVQIWDLATSTPGII
jgi:WD40 repeat protein